MEGLSHARGGSLIGSYVKKKFGANWFKGIVVQHYEKDEQWRVLYEDGDIDDCDQHDVEEGKFVFLEKEPPVVFEKAPPGAKVNEKCLFSINGLIRDDKKAARLIPCYSKETNIMLQKFFLFTRERELVRERKKTGQVVKTDKQGKKSYSKSQIMAEWAFCNVRREHDRGTQFLKEHMNERFLDQGGQHLNRREWVKTVLWKCYVYRQANRLESFRETGIPDPTSESLEEFIDKFSQLGRPYFSGMHNTPPSREVYERRLRSTMENDGEKLNGVVAEILDEGLGIEANSEEHHAHCKSVYKALRGLDGVGEFFAWQIMCDLSELGVLVLHEEYVVIGPGAKAGAEKIFEAGRQQKLIFENDSKQKILLEYASQIVLLQDVIIKALGIDFPLWKGKRLEVKEVEHILCEFSKYCEGRTRARYSTQCRFDRSQCFTCKRADDSDGVLCDTCNGFYCGSCRSSGGSTPTSWICSRCIAFQSHVWPEQPATEEEQVQDPDGDDTSTNEQENQLQAETDSRKRKAVSDYV